MTLWTPTCLGAIELPHRLTMAPMTRDRSRADGVPTDLNREYYRQRASMAVIITEGTQLRRAAAERSGRSGVGATSSPCSASCRRASATARAVRHQAAFAFAKAWSWAAADCATAAAFAGATARCGAAVCGTRL
jgi:2,4-dienoyl-CoA reductase-like NADH-dependent reductase (Old Yellow Enzyme family)